MLRRPWRSLLPLTLLAAVAACVININFDVPQTVAVQAPLPKSALPYSQPIVIDLSQQSEVQQHKGSVDSLAIDSLDLAVLQPGSSNTVTSLSGSIAFRPDGATDASKDVALGNFTLAVQPTPGTAHLQGNAPVDALLLNAVKGTGKFSVVFTVASTQPGTNTDFANFTLKATLHMAMGYNTGIF